MKNTTHTTTTAIYAADLISEQKQKRREELMHFDFVKERLQIEGPIKVESGHHWEAWYFDEELKRVMKVYRSIVDEALSSNRTLSNLIQMETENVIWHFSRLRHHALSIERKASLT